MALVEQGDGFELAHYRADAVALDATEFEVKYGKAFLLLGHDAAVGLQLALGPSRKTVSALLRADGEAWRPEDFRVWPVRKTPRSLSTRNISVGRTRTNDVVIPDVSLSKFHAFFRREDNVWTLFDAGSRNGTYVGDKRVRKTGEGAATIVEPGARIRFGSVELTFVDAAALRRVVLEVFE